MTDDRDMIAALERVRTYRYLAGTEEELQRQLDDVLNLEGITHEREFQLGNVRDGSRIDFYLPRWRAGLEVKVEGSPAAVLRQLFRYAGFPQIDALVLITRRARLGGLPSSIAGKPLHVLCLWEGAL